MSSFINTPEHFNSCEKSSAVILIDSPSLAWKLRDIYPKCASANKVPLGELLPELAGIFDTLRQLQVLTVSLQYRDTYEGKLDEVIQADTKELMSNKSRAKRLEKIELYKALRCIRYQIEIEHLTELRELTMEEKNALKFLDVFSTSLACDIVMSLDGYKNAPWDILNL